MKIARLICLALLLLLTSCSLLTQTPPDQAVELAIMQQLSRTQQSLAQDLGMLAQQTSTSIKPNFKIDSVMIQRRDKITDINQLNKPKLGQTVTEVYRVSGKFDTTLTTNSLQKQQKDSQFEVLLGRKATGNDQETVPVETWYFIGP